MGHELLRRRRRAQARNASSSTLAWTPHRGVAEVVREHGLRPAAVLVTHGHIDHMFSVAPVAGAYEAVAYIHPADRTC